MRALTVVNGLSCFVFVFGILMLCSLVEIGRKGINTILVPTDFSESSDVALQIAIDLAQQQGAKIHLLHVLRFRQPAGEIELLERQIAKFPETKSVEIVLEIRKGKIHEEILNMQTERNVDLIIIAQHRQTGSLYALFRSVTEKVKKKAQCSVLVVGA
jgi:nucleotide-binding universal stress UspA family protein